MGMTRKLFNLSTCTTKSRNLLISVSLLKELANIIKFNKKLKLRIITPRKANPKLDNLKDKMESNCSVST